MVEVGRQRGQLAGGIRDDGLRRRANRLPHGVEGHPHCLALRVQRQLGGQGLQHLQHLFGGERRRPHAGLLIDQAEIGFPVRREDRLQAGGGEFDLIHVRPLRLQRGAPQRVFRLIGQRVQRLHDRHARLDHARKLPAERNQVRHFHVAAKQRRLYLFSVGRH